jgi:hypothetical protein
VNRLPPVPRVTIQAHIQLPRSGSGMFHQNIVVRRIDPLLIRNGLARPEVLSGRWNSAKILRIAITGAITYLLGMCYLPCVGRADSRAGGGCEGRIR